jgi:hypothetical protein
MRVLEEQHKDILETIAALQSLCHQVLCVDNRSTDALLATPPKSHAHHTSLNTVAWRATSMAEETELA